MSSAVISAAKEDNKLRVEDRTAHDWYRVTEADLELYKNRRIH